MGSHKKKMNRRDSNLLQVSAGFLIRMSQGGIAMPCLDYMQSYAAVACAFIF